jgi:signal transduction histidine kinase
VPLSSATPSVARARQQRRRERSWGFGVCAAVALASFALDCLVAQRFVLPALLLRALWALQFLAAGWLLTRLSERHERRVYLAVAVLAPLFMGVLVRVTGVPGNPIIYWLLAMPPASAAFVHDDVRAVLGNAAASMVTGVALLAHEGQPARALLIFSMLLLTSSVVGVAGSLFFARSRAAELAADRARLEALQELATSERLRAESERLAVVGRLAAGVAHEVNNPLAFVMANLHCLQRDLGPTGAGMPPREVRELLAETGVGLERIRQIVSDLRTFAREDLEGPQACDVAQVVDEALRIASVRVRRVATVQTALEPGLPLAAISARRLSQVLVNLVMNAADALEARPGARVWVSARAHEGGLELRVEDNGPGLPPTTLERLFEPFFTTKPPGRGTGLGLALSREYVERHGGSLRADNRPEGGARFTLLLRRAPEQQEDAAPGSARLQA